MTETDVLARVARFRQAARVAVCSPTSLRQRCLALLDLADMARAEADPIVATWAERSIWEESKALLGVDDEQIVVPAEPYERAQRQLRAKGYTTCPTCASVLATDLDLERWGRLRRAEAERLAVRERSVRTP